MLKQPRRKINVYNFHLINLRRVHTGDNMKLFTMCLCISVVQILYTYIYLQKDLLNFFTLSNRMTRICVRMRWKEERKNATRVQNVCLSFFSTSFFETWTCRSKWTNTSWCFGNVQLLRTSVTVFLLTLPL